MMFLVRGVAMTDYSVGSLVKCRGREWVVLPSDNEDIFRLRPLIGSDKEITGIFRPFIEKQLETIEPAVFPLPSPHDASDAASIKLLYNSSRLILREGASPLRSLSRVSVRPRIYQYVPLLMALRLSPIKLLIADDVGIGKTIESLLIAREMIDQGEIKRLCVLCPPSLCDQWRQELNEKFHIDAKVVRSGTISSLERELPADRTIYQHYPFLVISIDYIKLFRNKGPFLQSIPDCVIVDEAHGASLPLGASRSQQMRYDLLKEISDKGKKKHLILLTATPHSGIESSFQSLLGLINPDFETYDLQNLTDEQRANLAIHFVQRKRGDIISWAGETVPFPNREMLEVTYDLSPEYLKLFKGIFEFSKDIVQTGETLTGWNRRIRYWEALALLRCVMSSPAAAVMALSHIAEKQGIAPEEMPNLEEIDESYSPFIFDPTDQEAIDVTPAGIIEEGSASLSDKDKKKILQFANLAASLAHSEPDTKVAVCVKTVMSLLKEGYNPIVWCRYIQTSEYVSSVLQKELQKKYPKCTVMSITGLMPDEERRERVKELGSAKERVLVATDCLSEGVNLQDSFSAVIHYDLPWNPNRLEQREGRVDRFGQRSPNVKTILLYGHDNPIDGAVLDVLLKKALSIRKVLGISVPIPMESEGVMEAVVKALFLTGKVTIQTSLTSFEEGSPTKKDITIGELHSRWDAVADREEKSRTRFAQHAIKPEEVERELKETDDILGDPDTVEKFVLDALDAFHIERVKEAGGTYLLGPFPEMSEVKSSKLPESVLSEIPVHQLEKGKWRIQFTTPPEPNVTWIGRNHPFVVALARYLFESAMSGNAGPARRCGVIRTTGVKKRTTLLLIRTRCSLEIPEKSPLLAESVLVTGYQGSGDARVWLSGDDSRSLLIHSTTSSSNIPQGEMHEILSDILSSVVTIQKDLTKLVKDQGNRIQESHKRIRKSVDLKTRGLSVKPLLPPDVLGILVLVPEVRL